MHRRDPSRNADGEISLRHFADVSDTSITFQIPNDAGNETRLLDEDNPGLLSNMDDSFGTPPAPRPTQAPLTLSELTPRRDLVTDLRDAISTELVQSTSNISTSAPHPNPVSVAPEDVKSAGDLPVVTPSRYNLRSKGGAPQESSKPSAAKRVRVMPIEKPLPVKPKQNTRSNDLKPRTTAPSRKNVPSEVNNLDRDAKSDGFAGGVVERLLQYGSQLELDTGYSTLVTIPAPTPASNDTPSTAMEVDDKGPLTLSQLTPRKREPSVSAEPVPPPYPTRSSRKRSASPTEHTEDTTAAGPSNRKRGSKLRGEGPAKRVKTTHLSSKLSSSTSSSAARAPKVKRVLRARPPKQGQATLRSSGKLAGSSSGKKSQVHSQGHGSDQPPPVGIQTDQNFPLDQAAGVLTESTGKTSKLPASTTLPPPKPTIPHEFRFTIEERLQARKHNPQADAAHKPLPGVPDFKALHAAQAEAEAHRKEHIHPTIPVPIQLSTEARLKERQKFDDMVRAKEEEMERQREQRRREREAEEEQEIKEMRRKAVPKAHEVPAWYAQAPKRRAAAEGST